MVLHSATLLPPIFPSTSKIFPMLAALLSSASPPVSTPPVSLIKTSRALRTPLATTKARRWRSMETNPKLHNRTKHTKRRFRHTVRKSKVERSFRDGFQARTLLLTCLPSHWVVAKSATASLPSEDIRPVPLTYSSRLPSGEAAFLIPLSLRLSTTFLHLLAQQPADTTLVLTQFFHPAFLHRATISLMSRERPRVRDTCLCFPYTILSSVKGLGAFLALPVHDTNTRRREPKLVSRETSRPLQPLSLPLLDAKFAFLAFLPH